MTSEQQKDTVQVKQPVLHLHFIDQGCYFWIFFKSQCDTMMNMGKIWLYLVNLNETGFLSWTQESMWRNYLGGKFTLHLVLVLHSKDLSQWNKTVCCSEDCYCRIARKIMLKLTLHIFSDTSLWQIFCRIFVL